MENRVASIVLLIIAILFGLALIPVVDDAVNDATGGGAGGSSTSTFTSTADFDAGTKAPTTDENLGVETTTDNPGIATGTYELGSLKGDAFNTASSDANTAKWNLIASTGVETVTRSIAGGVLNIDVEALAGGGAAGVVASASVSGNWDVRTKADRVVLTGTNDMARFNMLNENDEALCQVPTVDGVFYDARKGTDAGTWRTLAATCTNGVQTFVGTDSDNLPDPIWMRITKSGTTITWYYSSDGSSWTTDETTTFSTSATSFWTITSLDIADDGIATQIDFDDFHVSTGTVDSGGFRTIGNWTSASQSSTGSSADVTVTYSGASAAGFIDFICIKNGEVDVGCDNTDRTSGSSVTVTFAATIPSGWTVRVGLGGDGSATATVASVQVDVSSTTSGAITGAAASLIVIIPVLFIVSLVMLVVHVIWSWRTE